MLHAGERLGHKELLKLFNLYASGGNFWAKALFMIDSVINELDNKK